MSIERKFKPKGLNRGKKNKKGKDER